MLVEAKVVEKILPIHEAQLLSYLKLLDVPLGLLINFHELKLTSEASFVSHHSHVSPSVAFASGTVSIIARFCCRGGKARPAYLSKSRSLFPNYAGR